MVCRIARTESWEAKPLFKACSALKCRISFYKQEVSGRVYLQQNPHSGKQKKSWLLCFLVFLVIVAVHGCAQISASLWGQDRVGPAKEMGGKSDEARSPGWVGHTVLYDVQKAGVAKKKKRRRRSGRKVKESWVIFLSPQLPPKSDHHCLSCEI